MLAAANLVVFIVGTALLVVSSSGCDLINLFPIGAVSFAAAVKIATMIKTGIAQLVIAEAITDSPLQTEVVDAALRHHRRVF